MPKRELSNASPDIDTLHPPIRRPILFYACVILAFGLLGAAIIMLARVG